MHGNVSLFEDALTKLREVDAMLADADAGICLLHLEACIASLESKLRKESVGSQP